MVTNFAEKMETEAAKVAPEPLFKIEKLENSGTIGLRPDESILAEAERLVSGEKQKEYGDAKKSFDRIAALWSIVLEKEVTAHDVALCLIELKVSRQISSKKRDNLVDIAAYAKLAHDVD